MENIAECGNKLTEYSENEMKTGREEQRTTPPPISNEDFLKYAKNEGLLGL